MALSLRNFLDNLGDRLLRIPEAVDPITQVGVLCSESAGPVLFENLKGFPGWKMTDILVKTRADQAVALGCKPEEVVQHLAGRMYGHGPGKSVMIADAPCQEVVLLGDECDLLKLPFPIHSVGDGGRYMGSGITITKDPDTGVRNESIIRTQIKGPRKAAFWMAARHNWQHAEKYKERGQPMPIAYAVGLHPAYEILANWSGRHETFDELELCAGVMGETLEMVKCKTIDLEVPAHAELIIEGLCHFQSEPEGPFGEFTNYRAGKEGTAPVFEVMAITHRKDPIYRHMQATRFTDHQPLITVPMEATYFQRLQETHGHTAVHDVHVAPWASMFVMIVQISAKWDGQARDVLLSALSGPNLHPKVVIVVDEDVDIYNAQEVLWAISTRLDPAKDVIVIPHERIHPLDISVPTVADDVTVMRIGGKMGIDATKPPTWRTAERARYERVQPMGFDDKSLADLIARVRESRIGKRKEET